MASTRLDSAQRSAGRQELMEAECDRGAPLVLVVGGDDERRSELIAIFEAAGLSGRGADSPWAADLDPPLNAYSLIVLDGNLGDGGAYDVSRRLVASQSAPVIVLAENADVTDRIIALEIGADDLLSRPFEKRELVARARALLRRSALLSSRFKAGAPSPSSTLNTTTRTLTGPNGRRVRLSFNTFTVLQACFSRRGELLTSKSVAEMLSVDPTSDAGFRTTVTRVRKKLAEAGFDSTVITSARNGTYVVDPDVQLEII